MLRRPATIDWLRATTGLPVVVKGVLRADDALECVAAGASAVWVSNHGGRQLAGAVAHQRFARREGDAAVQSGRAMENAKIALA